MLGCRPEATDYNWWKESTCIRIETCQTGAFRLWSGKCVFVCHKVLNFHLLFLSVNYCLTVFVMQWPIHFCALFESFLSCGYIRMYVNVSAMFRSCTILRSWAQNWTVRLLTWSLLYADRRKTSQRWLPTSEYAMHCRCPVKLTVIIFSSYLQFIDNRHSEWRLFYREMVRDFL